MLGIRNSEGALEKLRRYVDELSRKGLNNENRHEDSDNRIRFEYR